MSDIANTAAMAGRNVRLSRRNLDALITSLMLPVMLMIVFVYLFGGAINTPTRYITYVVPGVLLLCAGFGAATTAVTVSQDMGSGIIDRFRSLDVGGAAVLGGHVAASLVRNTASTVLVFGVAFLLGFRTDADAGQWLAAAGILLLFIAAISWMGATVGLLVKSPEAANAFTFVAMFLCYASSALVPIGTMAPWIRGFAHHQPYTPVIETLRQLLAGGPAGDPWSAVAWCSGILVVSVTASALLFPTTASRRSA